MKYSLQTQISLEWREATTRNTSVFAGLSRVVPLQVFSMCFFFVSANVCLCNSAILIKASHAATPVYDSYYVILICLVLKSLKIIKKRLIVCCKAVCSE